MNLGAGCTSKRLNKYISVHSAFSVKMLWPGQGCFVAPFGLAATLRLIKWNDDIFPWSMVHVLSHTLGQTLTNILVVNCTHSLIYNSVLISVRWWVLPVSYIASFWCCDIGWPSCFVLQHDMLPRIDALAHWHFLYRALAQNQLVHLT